MLSRHTIYLMIVAFGSFYMVPFSVHKIVKCNLIAPCHEFMCSHTLIPAQAFIIVNFKQKTRTNIFVVDLFFFQINRSEHAKL